MPRTGARFDDLVAVLRLRYSLSPEECDELRMVLVHIDEGGIIIRHSDHYVLTWREPGASYRLDDVFPP